MDKILKNFEMVKFIITALKSILNVLKSQSCEMLKNVKNITLWNLQILYIFVLRTENWS